MTRPGDDDENNPLRRLTISGRFLVILTLAIIGGGIAVYVLWIDRQLPAGRYPIPYLILPVLLAAAAFFLFGRLVMRLTGVRFWRDDL